jgi:sulfonate transport system substrate-binding protein
MPPRSYQAGRFTWVFPCLKSLAPLGSRLPAPSRSRSRRAEFIEEGETLDAATAIVTGAGYGSPYSFTVASRAALADPAKAAAIRDYQSLLAQAHRWASTYLSAWAAVWAKARGLPSAVMRKAAADSAALAVPIAPAVAAFGQQVAGAYTASGLILVHVNFSQFADALSNATASAS